MDNTAWHQMLADLRQPFDPAAVSWKPQATTRDRKRCMAVAYVDTQAYQDRLDVVVPDWQDDYMIWFADPQQTVSRGGEKGHVPGKVFVMCRLTVDYRTRADVGECELTDDNALTSAKAQAFKRACAAFGLGRYLYDLPHEWVDYDDDKGAIPAEALKRLEGLLRRQQPPPPPQRAMTAAKAQPVTTTPPPAEPAPEAVRNTATVVAALAEEQPAVTTGDGTPAPDYLTAKRPWNREQLKHALQDAAAKAGTAKPNGTWGAALGILDEHGTDKRRALTAYVFGTSSSKELTDAQRVALVRWVKPAKGEGEHWHSGNEHLDAELAAVAR